MLTSNDPRFAAYDTIPDALLMVGPDGTISYANHWALDMFGYVADELVGAPVDLLVPEARRREHASKVAAFLAGSREQRRMAAERGLLTAVRKDGSEFPASITIAIADEAGSAATAVIRDETLTAEAQRARTQMAEMLERRNNDLEQVVFAASHDLREPLLKVTSFGHELKQALGDLDEWSSFCLDRMTTASVRMRELLDELVAFARASNGSGSVSTTDLGELFAEVIEDLSLRIDGAGARVEIVGTLPEVRLGKAHARQVFQNLVANSLKFSRPDVAPVVHVEAGPVSDGMVEIAVSDNGIGIHPKFAEAIFQPFRRLNGQNRFEGTGMGLTIVKKVLDANGGSIELADRATDDPGTTLVVRLPLADPTQAAAG